MGLVNVHLWFGFALTHRSPRRLDACFFCFHFYVWLQRCQLASVIAHLRNIAFHAAWESDEMQSMFAAAVRVCMFVCVLAQGHATGIAAITC